MAVLVSEAMMVGGGERSRLCRDEVRKFGESEGTSPLRFSAPRAEGSHRLPVAVTRTCRV